MLTDDEILDATRAGEIAFHQRSRGPRGTMRLPGDHDPTYWIARAVERAVRAKVECELAVARDDLEGWRRLAESLLNAAQTGARLDELAARYNLLQNPDPPSG